MDLRALGNQAEAGQHDIVFPAIEPGKPAIGPGMDFQALRIAIGPDRAFVMRGFQLAVTTENLAVPADEDQRGIDGALGGRIKLGDADDDINAGLAGGPAEPVRLRTGQGDGVFQIGGCRLPPQIAERRLDEEGIAGQPGLAEGSQCGPLAPGLGDEITRLVQRGGLVEEGRSRLDRGEGEPACHSPASVPGSCSSNQRRISATLVSSRLGREFEMPWKLSGMTTRRVGTPRRCRAE